MSGFYVSGHTDFFASLFNRSVPFVVSLCTKLYCPTLGLESILHFVICVILACDHAKTDEI